MTLLTVVQDVCAAVGVTAPQSVFSSITNNRTMQEMLSLANEMAQRIAYDTRDWTRLRGYGVHDGAAGTAEPLGSMSFPLPANFKRLLLTSNVRRSSNPVDPMRFVADQDEWVQRRQRGVADSCGEWILINGKLYVHPAVPIGVTVTYLYVDKNCVNLTGGGRGDSFMNDLDSFALDERVLKLGMIWQWKAQKGSSYAEDLGTYGDALNISMGHDSPAPIIIGRSPISAHARVAYPWPVPS